MSTTTTAANTKYKGFRLTESGTNNMDDLKKIVDDFLREIRQCPLDVTVCRNALSLLGARGMLIAFTPDQNQKIKLNDELDKKISSNTWTDVNVVIEINLKLQLQQSKIPVDCRS